MGEWLTVCPIETTPWVIAVARTRFDIFCLRLWDCDSETLEETVTLCRAAFV
jgi:hypothetical protein